MLKFILELHGAKTKEIDDFHNIILFFSLIYEIIKSSVNKGLSYSIVLEVFVCEQVTLWYLNL